MRTPKATVIVANRKDTLKSFLVRMSKNVGKTDVFYYGGKPFQAEILGIEGDRVSVQLTHGLFESNGMQVSIPLSSPARASFRATESGPVEWKFTR